ncbi:MAG: rhomboid family intramembrane serine protease [Planctomycetota bacterium]|nr:rhomboid family intramembrane serine protease [Planctomycetota bacterium]MEC9349639.1 rhomboid family intramembrane serine protease [Planctomycetota bacterium]
MNRHSFTNLYPVTSFLILINIGFFALQCISEGKLGLGPGRVMLDLGAIHGGSIYTGDYWRLISGTFLHGNVLHVAMNCMVLLDLGRFCEPRLSKSKFFSIYMLSALGGSISSYSWPALSQQTASLPETVSILLGQETVTGLGAATMKFVGHMSVGCSGALAGLIGLMLIYSVKERHAALRAGMLRWILFIGLITYFLPAVDHAGHLGGFLIGGICGLTVTDFATSKTSIRWRIPAGLTGLAMIASLAMAVYNFGKHHWGWN